ncbi:MAG: alkaline phosphatase family protein [Phycisphaerae bacterium]
MKIDLRIRRVLHIHGGTRKFSTGRVLHQRSSIDGGTTKQRAKHVSTTPARGTSRRWMLLVATYAMLTPGISAIRAQKTAPVIHKTATDRIISPVGTVAMTPNFAIGVVGSGNNVVVEASGAAFRQTLTVMDAKQLAEKSQLGFLKGKPWGNKLVLGISKQSVFQGLATGPDGMIYAAGGVSNNVLALHLENGHLKLLRKYHLVFQTFSKRQYPYQYQGEQFDSKGKNGPSNQGSIIPLPKQKTHSAWDFYPDSVAVGPGGTHIFTTGLLSNSVARINIKTGHTVYANAGAMPFQVVTADHGRRLVVSDWGDNGVSILDAHSLRSLGFIRIGPPTGLRNRLPGIHPTALATVGNSARVWVACANADILSEVDVKTMAICGMAMDRPYHGAPPGTFPDALAVADGKVFAGNAGNDDVAIFDATTGKAEGLIPTGWYPTNVCVYRHALYVVSAKGLGSAPDLHHQWIGDSMPGTVQRIALADLPAHLAAWTQAALANDDFSRAQRAKLAAQNQIATRFIHHHIRYVVFILRENKTFDEDFGAYKRAGKWADPQLDLYNRTELPNLYALADQYGLCVNFYMDGEVTAQGHQWTTSAEDSDFVQRTWPMYYSNRGIIPNPGWSQNLEGQAYHSNTGFSGADDPYSDYLNLSQLKHWSNPWISYPGGMFIFNDLLTNHVSFMDFGEFVSRSQAGQISPDMAKHLGKHFPAWNRFILDTDRSHVVHEFIAAHPNNLPHFMYIWLPDDHTAGRTPGYYTPQYYVANNDLATGQIVAELSRTPQWKHMAIFITEDDAQSGADHVDAHRSFAVIVSPWMKPGMLITHRYSQVNLMRTIEAITYVPPMSQWDANAQVLSGIWTKHPNFAPYKLQHIRVPARYNPGRMWPGEQLRRKAGKTGHWLSPRWLKKHPTTAASAADSEFTPTQLMKVPGPEQMRQEWIAVKGKASYLRVMAYLRHLAKVQHQPLTHYIASDAGDQ